MKRLLFLPIILILAYSCKSDDSSGSRNLASINGCMTGKWPQSSLPLQIALSDTITTGSSEVDALQATVQEWNSASNNSAGLARATLTQISNIEYSDPRSYRDGVIGIYRSNHWFSSITSAPLAITQYYGYIKENATLGKHIELTHADIILNYRDYGANLRFSNTFDIPTIVIHELGHLFGICHTDTDLVKTPSVMAPSYTVERRSLFDYDKEVISTIYSNTTNSSLAVQNAIKKKAQNTKHEVGEEIRGIVELHPDGQCKHYLDDQMIYEHKVDITKKHK